VAISLQHIVPVTDCSTLFVVHDCHCCRHTHTHTHTHPFYGPLGFCLGLPGWASTRKVKPGR